MGYLNFTSSAEGTAPTNAHPLAHTEYSQGEVSMGGEQDLPRERAVIVSLTDLRSRTQVFVKFGPRRHELSIAILMALTLSLLVLWMRQGLPPPLLQAFMQHPNALYFAMLTGTMLIYDLFNAFLFWNDYDVFADQEPDDWYWWETSGETHPFNPPAHIYCLPDGRLALGI